MKNIGMYRVYHYYGRPILATSAGSPYKLKMAWKCYQGFTFKRAVVRWVMQIAVSLHADKILSSLVINPLKDRSFLVDSWLKQVKTELDVLAVLPVIIWPRQIQRGRVYIYLLSDNCESICFCKISFDDFNDACLLRELHSIRYLRHQHLQLCELPAVLVDGNWNGHKYIIEEPLIMNALPSYPNIAKTVQRYRPCIEEYGGPVRLSAPIEVKSFLWWHALKNSLLEPIKCFVSELFDLICSCSGLPVRRVHGDLGPHNIIEMADQLRIIDWEESSENGPILTDEIGYYICVTAKSMRRRPKEVLRKFGQLYLLGASHERVRDVMAALAFRRTVATSDTSDTDVYIMHWNYLKTFSRSAL